MEKKIADIIKFNINRVYKLPKKYKYINIMLKENVKKDYLDLMNYLLRNDLELFYYQKHYTFFISATTLTYKVRKTTAKSITSNHYNYLAALGLIQKVEQHIFKDELTKINRKFITKYHTRPFNTYSLQKFTPVYLEVVEERAKQLYFKKITPGNITKDKLLIADLKYLADEVYPTNYNTTINWKDESYINIINYIDSQIKEKEYTTKQEIIKNVIINHKYNTAAIEKIFRMYSILNQYNYKRPTKEEKIKFNLTTDKYIITRQQI